MKLMINTKKELGLIAVLALLMKSFFLKGIYLVEQFSNLSVETVLRTELSE
jgi:hypothetical protein